MISDLLNKARTFEAQYLPYIPDSERPAFHLTGGIGWINDPNGFSVYQGEYHLFFQYHPYSTQWGPMHWGHVKTRDFVRWERLPVALAPDEEYDKAGCFSGSAVEMPDGRHLLMYTGVQRIREKDGQLHDLQTQCIAIGDGVNYEKYQNNPVLTAQDLPEGGSHIDFRDPKIWLDSDGSYYAVIGNRTPDGSGAILLYQSEDGLHWNYITTIDACRNQYGKMWECPDFFPLDGEQVLIVSPQEMTPVGLEFHPGHGTVCLIGSYNKEQHSFTRKQVQAIDYGIDFYAPQTLETPDGRRVMIAWMQNWSTSNSQFSGARYFGEMTFPRELQIRDGRLIQNPVRELEAYRCNRVAYNDVLLSDETTLQGVRGRMIDLSIHIRPVNDGYKRFFLRFAMDGEHLTILRYKPETNSIRIDRSRCGFPCDIVHTREFLVQPRNGELKIRALMDRHSVELFFNDGEQAATFFLYTPENADAISFQAEGTVLMDVEKYDIVMNENKQND